MLGHNDPATTQIYIDMARQKRLLEHSPSTTIARIIYQKSEKTQLLDTQSYDTGINTTSHFLGCAKHSKDCTLVLTTKKTA